ncbi:secreted RxLR effector protein 161-like [Pistacia vera]|uniref:secreted RxLR effector protein 161-like n=1 Tax=Pistacia vera TaxID=55513 RepID=UPI001262E355|nr:secreted RxLR effector protein 161-like [Pistacia vera]
MVDSKLVSIPLANHFVLSKTQCPETEDELIRIESVPYANVVGSVMYIMISTMPDLSFAISMLSQFMANPGSEHWPALNWVLRYINNSLDVGLEFYKRHASLDLVGFVDSNFAGDKDSRKSSTSYYFTISGNCISWMSQLQPVVALSSTEAEYISIADVFKEALWLQGILSEVATEDNPVDRGTKIVTLAKGGRSYERLGYELAALKESQAFKVEIVEVKARIGELVERCRFGGLAELDPDH